MNIVLETYGCTANLNDAEIIAGILEKKGCNVLIGNKFGKIKGIDIAIINTCIVKGPTLKRMERRIKDLLIYYKKLIISGCMGKVYKEKIEKIKEEIEKKYGKRYIAIVGPDQIRKIDRIINLLEKNKKEIKFYPSKSKSFKSFINLPKKRINRVIGITQISKGCLGSCSFCITKFVKGKLRSFEKNEIICSIQQDLAEGCKEIWLTGTDLGCYGMDRGNYELTSLIKEIIKLKNKFWLRLGMMNIEHVKNFIDELLELMESEKIFKFLHLPLQSGSDRVLKEMKRKYRVNDFLKIVKKFKNKFPNGTLATDIIAGFYNETQTNWKKTLALIKEIKPEVINLNRFWPMPKTLAWAKCKDRIKEIIEVAKKRSKELYEFHKQICAEKNKKFLDKKILILVDKKEKEFFLGRDINYKLIRINQKVSLGKFYKIKIKETKPNWLVGELL